MSKRKSIVSSFGQLTKPAIPKSQEPPNQEKQERTKARRVPAGVIGATERSMTDIRKERDRLLADAERDSQIIRLSPDDIDPSPFRDRLPDDQSDTFLELMESLKEEGQKVPISVRRHPGNELRYQVVFGHRRWRALRELGQTVDARLGEFSDRDLVVAQGIENATRQDLTWIERAMFCSEMENAGIKARDIRASLNVDDAQLSKFRQVMRALPGPMIEKIGKAPKVGRPRWLELADLVRTAADRRFLERTLSADKVLELSSDDRFLAALKALKARDQERSVGNEDNVRRIGRLGTMTFGRNTVRIVVKSEHSEAFLKFIASEMESLEQRFLRSIDSN